jgi:hypothetical protein
LAFNDWDVADQAAGKQPDFADQIEFFDDLTQLTSRFVSTQDKYIQTPGFRHISQGKQQTILPDRQIDQIGERTPTTV